MTHKPQHDPASPSPADANPDTDCVEPRESGDELGAGIPQPGEIWVKRSYPIPTVVTIESVDGKVVTAVTGRRYSLPVDLFLAQGFVKHETWTNLSRHLKRRA